MDTLTHLGTKVTNKIDGCQDDLKMKTATYIQKNCSIIQEFNYAHPITLLDDFLNFKHGTLEPPWKMDVYDLDNIIQIVCTT